MTAPMKPGDAIARRCIGRIEPALILAPGESKCLPVERADADNVGDPPVAQKGAKR